MTGHNISFYDTGRVNSYTRRNEGWAFASCMAAGFAQIFLVPFLIGSVVDPTMGGMFVTVVLGFFEVLLTGNLLMFVMHRNFNLNEAATDANDALYLLPKQERKRWKITRNELNSITTRESNELVNAVYEYRRNTPSAAGGISRLTQALNDVNNEYKMIEGK